MNANARAEKAKPQEPDKVAKALIAAYGGEKGGYARPKFNNEGSVMTFLRNEKGASMKRDYDAAETADWDPDLKFTTGIKNVPPGADRQKEFDSLAMKLINGQVSSSDAYNDLQMMAERASKRQEFEMRSKAAQDRDPVAATKKVEQELKKRGEKNTFFRIPGYVENWSSDPKHHGTKAMVGVMIDPKTNNTDTVIQWYKDNGESETIIK